MLVVDIELRMTKGVFPSYSKPQTLNPKPKTKTRNPKLGGPGFTLLSSMSNCTMSSCMGAVLHELQAVSLQLLTQHPNSEKKNLQSIALLRKRGFWSLAQSDLAC